MCSLCCGSCCLTGPGGPQGQSKGAGLRADRECSTHMQQTPGNVNHPAYPAVNQPELNNHRCSLQWEPGCSVLALIPGGACLAQVSAVLPKCSPHHLLHAHPDSPGRVELPCSETILISSIFFPVSYEELSLSALFLFSKEIFGSIAAFFSEFITEVSPWKSQVWHPRAEGRWSAGPSPKISLTMGCLGEGWGREVDSAEVLSPQVKSQLRQYEFVKFSLSLAILQCSGWCKLSRWYCGRPIAIISKLFQSSRDVQGDWPSIKMYCVENSLKMLLCGWCCAAILSPFSVCTGIKSCPQPSVFLTDFK